MAKAELQKEKANTALAILDMSADAGAGMENATQESFAIPFLSVLQKNSPQVDETSGAAIEGAKQGMFFENVTGRMFDGKTGVTLVQVAYRRTFLRWAPRDAGGGFKGEFTAEQVAKLRESGQIAEVDGKLLAPLPDGTLHDKKCDKFADTRLHYCLLVDESTGLATNVLLSLASTQIKKSKQLMALLASVKRQGAQGPYTPPTFGVKIRATTLPESNDLGSWMGLKFELSGDVTDHALYAQAKAFNISVNKGSVTSNFETVAAEQEQAQPTTF